MDGLVENNYRTNPAWIKSCENFRSGENNLVQPKYFHTDDNVYIRDWYKAAYPTDTWGAGCINPNVRFKDWTTDFITHDPDDPEFGITQIVDATTKGPVRFDDSIVEYRVKKELEVDCGFSFGYIIDD